MRKNAWVPVLFWVITVLVYAFKHYVNRDWAFLYPLFLYSLPLLLVLLKKISFSDLGLKTGNPLNGLFLAFLLPTVLFLRFKLMGSFFQLNLGYHYLLLTSVGEEFFFRGYLQEQFNQAWGENISLAATNLLFMLIHTAKGYSLINSLIIFIIGVYFSLARDKRAGDSTIYAMIAHSLYNLITTSRT